MTNTTTNTENTDSYYKKNRVIYFDKEFTDETLSSIIQTIIQYNMEDDTKEKEVEGFGGKYGRKPVTLYISSYGGSVYDLLSLVGVIKSSKTPVHTIAVGKVMSSGFILLCAGHKRFAKPYTTFMYHSILSVTFGKLQDMKEDVEEVERLQNILDDIVVEASNIKRKTLNKIVKEKRDWYFDISTALEYKLIESVV